MYFILLYPLPKYVCLRNYWSSQNGSAFCVWTSLFQMRKSSTFISTMFLIHIFTTSVLGPLRIYFFFNIGNSHFVTKQSNIVEDIQVCKFYIVTSGLHLMFSIFINTGMIFCRFIYVRYAKGLLSMGSKLLHVLVYLLIGTYFLRWLLMFLIPNFFLLEDVDLNSIQKRICTKNRTDSSPYSQNWSKRLACAVTELSVHY